MNALAPSSSCPDWVTLKPGERLCEAVPRNRTRRLVDGLAGRLLLGRYRLGRLIDESTLCGTYEAYDIETRKAVAVELFAAPKGARPSARDLRREAKRIVSAVHPSLRSVRDIGVDDSMPFIVAVPVTGPSLKERIESEGALPIREAVAIALQVIDAMSLAHANGLVHGNLKPSKVRTSKRADGTTAATVMGLGVTTLLRTMRDIDTRGLGTPPYLAPEQLTTTGAADELTDVWGIGLLLFEMLTGKRAFDGTSADEVARRITGTTSVRLRHLRYELPVALERIVIAALARPREQRLSLRDLRRALEGVLPECPLPSAPAPEIAVISCADPCDDVEGPTDLHVWVETDLGSL